MTFVRTVFVICLTLLISGCEPPKGVSQEQLDYHKANRASDMYQGI